MSLIDDIRTLAKQLYPTGRVFNMTEGEFAERLDKGLIQSEKRMYEDALSVLFEILADNDNFTAEDATRWEVRLGLITNASLSLADRKAAILRKYNHPGDIPARQSWDYLEQSLQAAGFDVYVHENPNAYNVIQVIAMANPVFQNWGQNNFGTFNFGNVLSTYPNLFNTLQWGNANFGQYNWGQTNFYNQKVVNHIDYQKDVYFSVTNWLTAFYIGGQTFGTFADVDINRREEFRQLILKIKPAQSVGILLINYV